MRTHGGVHRAREVGHLGERGCARGDWDSEQGRVDRAQSELAWPAGVAGEAHCKRREQS